MLGNFLDKATGLLDRNFLLAYWFPVFISASVAILVCIWVYGFADTVNWWQQDLMTKGQESGFYAQIMIVAAALVLVTILAYLLQPLTRTVVRIYEGYWPLALRDRAVSFPLFGERQIWKGRSKERKNAEEKRDWSAYNFQQARLYYEFPSREDRLMPTRLGNVIRAAEDYSKASYGMDSVFWWPRLWPLLPEALRKDIDESLTPLVAMLNFSSLILLISLACIIYLGWIGLWWRALVVAVGGILLASVTYRASVAQALSYGDRIRSAVDLYRFKLLKALSQPLPETLDDEIKIWEQLMVWLYNNDRGAVTAMRYSHSSDEESED